MADKKMTRSEKMYKDSPKLERKENGSMGITKAEKKSAEVNSGTAGIPTHESHALGLSQKHEKERLDLHQKHEREHHDLTSKHTGATGGEMIEKIEKDKKE